MAGSAYPRSEIELMSDRSDGGALGEEIQPTNEPSSDLESDGAEIEGAHGHGMSLDFQDEDRSDEGSDGSPVIRLLIEILDEALQLGASHVHFQPTEHHFLVRYRIDGILSPVRSLPRRVAPVITGRLKVMADMDVAEKRRPQGGRFWLVREGRPLLNVDTVPTLHGERITLQIGRQDKEQRQLHELGFAVSAEQTLRRLISEERGLLIVTGPTGGGITTTLHAMVSAANSPERNLLTIEYSIERQLKDISQIEVRPQIGNDISSLLRHARRQDADVVMCSELVSCEPLEQAIQMALTGCLVLGGMHTRDAVGTICRLLDTGLEPGLVAASLLGVVGQRLARRICDDCRETYQPGDEELRLLSISRDRLEEGVLWKGRGCDQCRNTGYSGRIAIHDVLILDDSIRELVRRHATRAVLKKQAIESGLKTFRADGRDKVLQGLTTIEEVLRVAPKT